jgi:hypothetical protein
MRYRLWTLMRTGCLNKHRATSARNGQSGRTSLNLVLSLRLSRFSTLDTRTRLRRVLRKTPPPRGPQKRNISSTMGEPECVEVLHTALVAIVVARRRLFPTRSRGRTAFYLTTSLANDNPLWREARSSTSSKESLGAWLARADRSC